MSSHHFVKEKQEPALLIMSDSNLDRELMGQLLEWCPVVVIDEHALYQLNDEIIKIDFIIQRDLPLSEIESWVSSQDNVKMISLDSHDDKLSSVLKYLEKEGHHAISIISCDENKFEKLLSFETKIDLILYTEFSKSFFMKVDFHKWKEKSSIIGISGNPVSTKNLIKTEDGLFTVEKDNIVEIKTDRRIMIKEFEIGRGN